MNLTGNTIFIPGATSGIGLGLAMRLHDAGNTVIVGGRRTELLEQIISEHPGLHAVTIDTADPTSITAVYDEVTVAHPTLNVLITMAGIMLTEDLHRPDFLATAESTITTNLLGPIRLIAAFTPFLSAQKEATIMTVSSGLAYVPLPLTPTYSATKAAIHSFTESLRVQLSDTSIEVIELAPPGVQTTLMNQQDSDQAMPLGEFLDETMALLAEDPNAEQILVENVKYFRFAEANGSFKEALGALSNY